MLKKRCRFWLGIFIAGLVLSGLTALPIQTELSALLGVLPQSDVSFLPWLRRVHAALADTNQRYPFLAYGTDWLAFAHLVIAIAFIGPWLDPVRNKWLISFGLMPAALCCHYTRHLLVMAVDRY